jgi:hypothetical protein
LPSANDSVVLFKMEVILSAMGLSFIT